MTTWEQFEARFRKRKTSTLLKEYKNYNQSFQAIARSEFKKRNVPVKKLPYKSVRSRIVKQPTNPWSAFGRGF